MRTRGTTTTRIIGLTVRGCDKTWRQRVRNDGAGGPINHPKLKELGQRVQCHVRVPS